MFLFTISKTGFPYKILAVSPEVELPYQTMVILIIHDIYKPEHVLVHEYIVHIVKSLWKSFENR